MNVRAKETKEDKEDKVAKDTEATEAAETEAAQLPLQVKGAMVGLLRADKLEFH